MKLKSGQTGLWPNVEEYRPAQERYSTFSPAPSAKKAEYNASGSVRYTAVTMEVYPQLLVAGAVSKLPDNTKTIVRRQRLRHRLLAHHVPLLVISVASTTVIYCTRPYPDVITRISFATAYPALVLLAITLLIGPWNILRRRRSPISSDFRRDTAIWAAILSIVHSVIGQNMHLRGRPWLYYVYMAKEHHSFPLRHDLFGFSNYTGAVSALVIIALLATSNDYSLKRLGTPRWKQLQRWNYAAFALAAAHTVGYQIRQKQNFAFHLTTYICIAITLVLQIAGFLRRRSARSDNNTILIPREQESKAVHLSR
ncbi:MAG TPA: ferric reductase-like transmembrane domain-containing protein [Edaphobacter sp.]|nr:ferric reductase-like transmembrane domain-containing protein [Edaphobacter sp.]